MGFLGGILGMAMSPIQGAIGAGGARRAAGAQQAGQQAAANLYQGYYNNALDFGAPYRTAGHEGLQNLQMQAAPPMPSFQGQGALDPGPYGFQTPYPVPDVPQLAFSPQGYQFSGAPYQFSEQPYAFSQQPYNFSGQPYAFNPPSGSQVLQQDPGYQFRLQQGMKALQQQGAAGGQMFSGGQLKAAQQYGQGLASQEYDAAYNRALGQNQLAYGRALGENQIAYGRGLDVNQLAYGRGLEANQLAYGRGLEENQLRYGRDYQANQDYWNRAMQAQGTVFGQALQQNQLGYGRAYQQNQDQYQRAAQDFQMNQQARQQRYNELANLAGLGATQSQNAANLTMNYAQGAAPFVAGVGTAQAGGIAGATNAWLQALQNMQNSASSIGSVPGLGNLGGIL